MRTVAFGDNRSGHAESHITAITRATTKTTDTHADGCTIFTGGIHGTRDIQAAIAATATDRLSNHCG